MGRFEDTHDLVTLVTLETRRRPPLGEACLLCGRGPNEQRKREHRRKRKRGERETDSVRLPE